jgi:hypothetical protein
MIQGSELDFGVVLICLSKLAKKLSLPYQTHLQSRSFRMKGQSSSFSTAPGLAETDVLYLERAPTGRAVSQCSRGPRWPLCRFRLVRIARGSSATWAHTRSQMQGQQNEHLHKNGGGVPPIIFATYSEYQQWAGVSAKHCEALPLQVEYCETR